MEAHFYTRFLGLTMQPRKETYSAYIMMMMVTNRCSLRTVIWSNGIASAYHNVPTNISAVMATNGVPHSTAILLRNRTVGTITNAYVTIIHSQWGPTCSIRTIVSGKETNSSEYCKRIYHNMIRKMRLFASGNQITISDLSSIMDRPIIGDGSYVHQHGFIRQVKRSTKLWSSAFQLLLCC